MDQSELRPPHEAAPDEDAGHHGQRGPFAEAFVSQLGGWRGLVESGLPTAVFVTVNTFAGLQSALRAAAVVGILLFLYRLVRREPVQQALSGLGALAIAVLVAQRLGEARGFFLPGIVISSGYALAFAVSCLIRRPLVGVVWGVFDGSGMRWRRDGVLLRAFTVATWGWAAVFGLRAAVQGLLYLDDAATALGIVKIGMGLPVTVVALVATLRYVSKAKARSTAAVAGAAASPES